MRPHLQFLFPCLATLFSVCQTVDFVNILERGGFLHVRYPPRLFVFYGTKGSDRMHRQFFLGIKTIYLVKIHSRASEYREFA